jgi:hypothetical protein
MKTKLEQARALLDALADSQQEDDARRAVEGYLDTAVELLTFALDASQPAAPNAEDPPVGLAVSETGALVPDEVPATSASFDAVDASVTVALAGGRDTLDADDVEATLTAASPAVREAPSESHHASGEPAGCATGPEGDPEDAAANDVALVEPARFGSPSPGVNFVPAGQTPGSFTPMLPYASLAASRESDARPTHAATVAAARVRVGMNDVVAPGGSQDFQSPTARGFTPSLTRATTSQGDDMNTSRGTPAVTTTSTPRPASAPHDVSVASSSARTTPSSASTSAPRPHPVPAFAARPQETRLPNANAGRSYVAEIRSLLPGGKIEVLPQLPEGLVLSAEGHLTGTPRSAGEYRIGWREISGAAQGALLLTVNADPRSLWKDIASDRNAKYWKPDTAIANGESPVARAIVASVRGRSHAHVGSFRDDDFAIHFPTEADGPHGWHILVVADGAGSAKYSRKGSQIACEVVAKQLVETLRAPQAQDVAELVERSLHATEQDKSDSAFWSPRLYNTLVPAVAKAQSAVRAEAEALGVAKKDFHTTLLLAVVRRTTAGAWFIGTYWIGDGAIGMWDGNWMAPKVFGEADAGEFAGETTFLTYEDFMKPDVVNRRLRYSIVPSFSYLALMTDGISDPKFDAETKLKSPDAWRAFTADLMTGTDGAQLADMTDDQLLAWMQFWSQGNHDDRTLLLFHPRVPAGDNA